MAETEEQRLERNAKREAARVAIARTIEDLKTGLDRVQADMLDSESRDHARALDGYQGLKDKLDVLGTCYGVLARARQTPRES